MSAIVIGAGLAGLAVSLCLSRIGFRVHLVEKYEVMDVRGASLSVRPNGRRALEEICPGINDELDEVGISKDGGLLCIWHTLRDVLLHNVKRSNHIRLYMGKHIESITAEDDEDVTVRFSNDVELVLRGQFVIGADGVDSKVRDIIGLPPARKGGTVVWRGSVDATASEILAPLLEKGITPMMPRVFNGTYFSLLNFHPKVKGRLAWLVSTNVRNVEKGVTTPYSLLKDSVPNDELSILHALRMNDETENDALLPYPETRVHDMSDEFLSTVDGWGGKGRVLLIGDAAHAMRPTDGLGASMAFEDCVVLRRMLLSSHNVTNERHACRALFSNFEKERLPRVKRIHDDQRIRYHKRLKENDFSPWPDEFKEWIHAGV